MGKLTHLPKFKSKLTWQQFVNFWKARGLTPGLASNILAENYLDKDWTNYKHNMFRSKENRDLFIQYLEYVNKFMIKHKLKFRAALIKLCSMNDLETFNTLLFLLVPRSVSLASGKILIAPTTFAKLVGQWRKYLEDKGFIDEWSKIDYKYLEIKNKKIDKTILKAGLAIKSKSKKK